LFQPALSQGLHWYSAYIYSKRNPHKIGTNLTQKYITKIFSVSTVRAPNSPIRAPIFHALPDWKDSANSGPGQHHSGPELEVSRKLSFSNFESLSQQLHYSISRKNLRSQILLHSQFHDLIYFYTHTHTHIFVLIFKWRVKYVFSPRKYFNFFIYTC